MLNYKFRNFYFLLLGLFQVMLWVWLTQKGFGLTADAKAYLYAAETFRKKGELLTPNGYYTNWVPLFPVLLSFLPVKVLFCVTLVANLMLLYLLVVKMLDFCWQGFLCYAQIIFSAPFVMIHFFVWSEAIFLLLLLALVLLYAKILYQKKISTKALVILVIISNFLCLQRMAGVFFVMIFAWLIGYYVSWKKAVAYLSLSLVGMVLWLIRNSFLQAKPDFLDNIFVVEFYKSLVDYAEVIVKLFLPAGLLYKWVVLLIFVGLSAFMMPSRTDIFLVSLYKIFVFYFLVMLILRMNVAFESDRYMAPVMPLVQILFWKKLSNSTFPKWLLDGAQVAVLLYNFARTTLNVVNWYYFPPLEMY